MFEFSRNQLVAAYLVAGLALVGTGVLVARSGVFHARGEVQLTEAGSRDSARPGAGSAAESDTKPAGACVHVVGSVKNPGVYNLGPDSRVTDAIKAAGGIVGAADLENINLAEKLQDGQQVYIAVKGRISPPAVSVVKGGVSRRERATGASDAVAGDKKGPQKLKTPGEGTVNINTADLEELQSLPGIGPAMAQRILDYRAEHGRFQSVEELDEISGIGSKKLETLRPFVTL